MIPPLALLRMLRAFPSPAPPSASTHSLGSVLAEPTESKLALLVARRRLERK